MVCRSLPFDTSWTGTVQSTVPYTVFRALLKTFNCSSGIKSQGLPYSSKWQHRQGYHSNILWYQLLSQSQFYCGEETPWPTQLYKKRHFIVGLLTVLFASYQETNGDGTGAVGESFVAWSTGSRWSERHTMPEWALENSDPRQWWTSSNKATPTPIWPHLLLLIFLKQCQPLVTKHWSIWAYGGHSHSKHHKCVSATDQVKKTCCMHTMECQILNALGSFIYADILFLSILKLLSRLVRWISGWRHFLPGLISGIQMMEREKWILKVVLCVVYVCVCVCVCLCLWVRLTVYISILHVLYILITYSDNFVAKTNNNNNNKLQGSIPYIKSSCSRYSV